MKYIKLFELKARQETLVKAAEKGNINIVKKLLNSGVDINIRGDYGQTALMEASSHKFLMLVDFLIKSGADVNAQDKHGRTALILYSTPSILLKLLDAGADINMQDNEGKTAIMQYIHYSGSIDSEKMCSLIETFLEKGLDLSIENNKGETFYDILQNETNLQMGHEFRHFWLNNVIDYIDKNHPEIREDWELKNMAKKYNL
jgi:serine/threonine-protein phosphatase 6 regulatory ankyrin repeat subunit B